MIRRVVIDPHNRPYVPVDFEAQAEHALARLPERWDRVACVAAVKPPGHNGDGDDWTHGEYLGPRWCFIRGSRVLTITASFEEIERMSPRLTDVWLMSEIASAMNRE